MFKDILFEWKYVERVFVLIYKLGVLDGDLEVGKSFDYLYGLKYEDHEKDIDP